MKCRDCGKEGFANVGEVGRHKRDECPARAQESAAGEVFGTSPVEAVLPFQKELTKVTEERDRLRAELESARAGTEEKASLEAIQRMATELGIGFLVVKESRKLVIPNRFLPSEVKYLGNSFFAMKVSGYLVGGDLVVDKAERIR